MTAAQRPSWLLDEVASAGRENLDAEHVQRYDGKEDSNAPAEVALLQELGLNRDSVVVELGPGTGQLAVALAPHCQRIVAVDVSQPMIEHLRARLTREQIHNVDVAHAGFLSFDLPAASADFVYTRLALHHLPDFWKAIALQRIHTLLRPGGVLRLWDVVYSFDTAQAAQRIEEWCATGRDVAPFTPLDDGWGRWEIEEHVRDEHSTFTWILEPMLERVGFTIEQAEYGDDVWAKYVARRA